MYYFLELLLRNCICKVNKATRINLLNKKND